MIVGRLPESVLLSQVHSAASASLRQLGRAFADRA